LGCCTSKGLANEYVAQIHPMIFSHLLLLPTVRLQTCLQSQRGDRHPPPVPGPNHGPSWKILLWLQWEHRQSWEAPVGTRDLKILFSNAEKQGFH